MEVHRDKAFLVSTVKIPKIYRWKMVYSFLEITLLMSNKEKK